jgi:hypothetical protein
MAAVHDASDELWTRLAFLGRYGHQNVLALFPGGPTSLEVNLLNQAIGDLIKQEADATREAAASGGG